MAGLPKADVEITEELVRHLVATSPWPTPNEVHFVARGFDNETWWADGRGVRIPRRELAVPALLNEQRWLNEVVADLAIATPALIFRGEPTDRFAFPWSITHFTEGTAGIAVAPTVRGDSAHQLGTVLRTLHRTAPTEAPTNAFRGVALQARHENLLARLASVDDETRRVVERWFEQGLSAAEHDGPLVWLHGDVHPGNLIFNEGELVGLIDFSDLCAGDPAVDVGGALFSLPAKSHAAFWSGYGTTDDDLRARAHAWAVLFVILHLQIELEEHTTLAHEALAWLAAAT